MFKTGRKYNIFTVYNKV